MFVVVTQRCVAKVQVAALMPSTLLHTESSWRKLSKCGMVQQPAGRKDDRSRRTKQQALFLVALEHQCSVQCSKGQPLAVCMLLFTEPPSHNTTYLDGDT
jgi:hypothetical protein